MPKTLTPAEYRNAIYLDFEGEGKKRNGSVPMPHMAGIFKPNMKGKSGQYSSIFFLEAWKPLFSHFNKTAILMGFSTYFEILAKELIANSQYLVCWSIHEPMILKKYLSTALFHSLSPQIHNLHPVAKQYARRQDSFGPETKTYGKTLENYFEALYEGRDPFPSLYLGAAEICRRIDAACFTHKKWRYFPDLQKGYAKDLICYNSGDCRSTWLIAKKIGNYSNG